MTAQTVPRGRHHRTGGTGPRQWLRAPAPGDHRDRLGPPTAPMPRVMGAPVPGDVMVPAQPGPRTPPSPWYAPRAGANGSALLQPAAERPDPAPRPGHWMGRPRPVLLTFLLVIACFLGTFAGTFAAVDLLGRMLI